MANSAMTNVFDNSPSKGNARLVELVMAEAVNEKRLKRGESAEAWLSQNTIAARCNCSRSSVERAVDELKRLGRIVDTGRRMTGRYRGTVVYLLPQPGDLTQTDVTQSGSAVFTVTGDLTHSAEDLTHSGRDLTHSDAGPDPKCPPKPVVNREQKPEPKPEGGRADAPATATSLSPSAPDYPDGQSDAARVAAQRQSESTREYVAASGGLSCSSSGPSKLTAAQLAAERLDDERELAALEAQRETTAHSDVTERAIASLRERLGLPVEVAL